MYKGRMYEGASDLMIIMHEMSYYKKGTESDVSVT